MIETIFRFLFAAVLGAAFGSFANVLTIRLHEERTLLGRSMCPSCNAVIRPRHLVPIFSWLALRGKCADCGAKIHIQYPLVEVLTACLSVVVATRFDPTHDVRYYGELLLVVALVVCAVMDFRWKELPLELMVLVGGVAGIVRMLFAVSHGTAEAELLSIGLACVVAIGFFGAQWLVSKGAWLGSGDIWFAGMMAFVLAWPATLVGMYLSYVVGGVVVLGLFFAGVVRRGTRIPFAPALACGLLLAQWYGDRVVSWFLYALS